VTDFSVVAAPFRAELVAHCYRLLGSVHDAEDVVQETYLRAWRGYARFEGRSSVRHWLYTIATRACLTAIERGARRPLPSGLGAPADDHRVALGPRRPEITWLEPLLATAVASDPAAVVATQTGVRLAFVAALQYLPARQRAVLVLRDVLAWSAAEVADMLGTSTASVNSALQRARAHLHELGLDADEVSEPDDAATRDLVARYAEAFEQADLDALVALVRADVELEMPPQPMWFTGRDAVVGFLRARVLSHRHGYKLVPTRANGQPAYLTLTRDDDGSYAPHGVQVLTLHDRRIARITAFNDARLVPAGVAGPQ
jgi:RNA polymerase sigma-70 factor (TIGR02960 family)